MRLLPRLAALATAVPPHRLDQDNVVARVEQLFGRSPDFERLIQVYANSDIDCRYSVMPFAWFDEAHSWSDRNAAYLAGALDLIEAAARRALDRADLSPAEIGAIVTVSTTGIATPSLDALLMERLAFPRDAVRLPIFGLGCAGGALGLARAAALATAMPERPVLLLVVELCTLQFRRDDLARSNIVATALFGDGAAAAVLRVDGNGPAITASGEHTWPNSLDIMGWDVAEDGLKAVFSRDIPRLVTAELGPVLDKFLAARGLSLRDIDRFVCHPGGPKVIDAYEAILGADFAGAAAARHSLAQFGNMSAASVLFVLEEVLAETRDPGEPVGRVLLTALGPGFSAGFVLLEAP
ncbi:MAG TPA: 3-oxoacyl-[acyl-carrier-protein] synthase III C-terminal domain-containing protein [Stellaceae bacterium]|jgi:alkylresorcinol/alkylpyrone synthase|nr:3-oxoacyl-[acyl-carrier-protein] synthase III C-terminal domain-containing protein [Stellaceae bacterium]